MENENKNKIIALILTVIPLAMSVAVVALMILKQINADTGIIMLAIGMFANAIGTMRNSNKSE